LRSTTGQTKIDAANRGHTMSNNAMIPLVRLRDLSGVENFLQHEMNGVVLDTRVPGNYLARSLQLTGCSLKYRTMSCR
jgi:hypothetical protein